MSEPDVPAAAAAEPPEPAAEPAPETPWRRLDPRTLLTGPVSVLKQLAIPLIAGIVGITSSSPFGLLIALPAAAVGTAVIGAIPWLTTTFRVTGTHLEVRRGLLNRSTLTARLDRVRGVELEADIFHRVLGITKLRVGTGVDEGQIALDALSVGEAEELRTHLLRAAHDTPALADTDTPGGASLTSGTPAGGAHHGREIVRLDWGWVRFAPLNLANAAVILAGMGVVVSQLGELVPDRMWPDLFHVQVDGADDVRRAALVALAVLGVLLVLWVPVSCLGYAVRWGGLRVVREEGRDGPVLRRAWGLLTTRSSTVEEAKVRGAVVRTPFLVGLAGGAELSLLTTGLEDNEPDVLPTAPRAAVLRVGADVLDETTALTTPLVGHGPSTRQRYRFRALVTAAVLATVVAVPVVLVDELTWWLPVVVLVVVGAVGVLLGEMRWRRLGHRVTDRYVVVRTGTLGTARTVLESDSVVGWRVRQTWFDRRRGLAQLTATTAAGPEQVTIPDVPIGEAVALTAAATPRTVADFLEPTESR